VAAAAAGESGDARQEPGHVTQRRRRPPVRWEGGGRRQAKRRRGAAWTRRPPLNSGDQRLLCSESWPLNGAVICPPGCIQPSAEFHVDASRKKTSDPN
jgi:hypothetical protein